MLQTEVKKVYSFLNPSINSWDLTENEEIAKQDSTYAHASLEDLNDMACGRYTKEGKILTSVGKVVQWYEESSECEYGCIEEYLCGYKLMN